MRADRLLSIMLLLQGRGKMTAGQLSKELEVSERTIYRDIDALSAAGVPVYGEAGPSGGFALIDSYRTNLTGLTDGEVRALFMLTIPAPLADLGVDQELRIALRKLSAALPAGLGGEGALVRQRIHIDSTWWSQGQEAIPHLETIQDAVWQDRKIRMTCHPMFSLEIERLVSPYGLVAKGGVWYLIFARRGGLFVQRVANIVDVLKTDEPFERPPNFDLASFWELWCVEREESRTSFRARVQVAANFVPYLPMYFGSQIQGKLAKAERQDEGKWTELELFFESLEAARDRILSFGGGVRVIEPWALRRSTLDYAEQIVAVYRNV